MKDGYLYFKLLDEQLSLEEGEDKKNEKIMCIEVINEEGNCIGKVNNSLKIIIENIIDFILNWFENWSFRIK